MATACRWAFFVWAVVAAGLVARADADEGDHAPQLAPPASSVASGSTGAASELMPGTRNLVLPEMNAGRGRKLFASKGCVACHSINGVGGHDATALDAHSMQPMMNPFDFAAKMWQMAPAMIYAQDEALGGQILFSGQELADIIAFVHDDEAQHGFSETDIPPEVVPLMHHRHRKPDGPAMHREELGHQHGPMPMHR
jgi:mono/diheme cytochrome c family protein